MTTRPGGTDLVELLLDDHEEVERLFAATRKTERLDEAFAALVRALVVHEVVEEEIVYPAFRRAGGSEDVADSRLAEQQSAERLLLQIEHMTVGSEVFIDTLRQIELAVAGHAQMEEKLIFPVVKTKLDDEERRKLGRAYAAAKKFAPTHPHPHAPNTPPGNLVVGPFVGLIDRARDTARSALAKARG